jgi:hypothetical protein
MNDFPTFETAQTVERKMLERDIQENCVAWARNRGYWARKFSSPANRAVPDYIFGRGGFTLFVEFKAKGKKPTNDQLEEHAKMAKAGLMVHVFDDVTTFKTMFVQWEQEAAHLAELLT